MQEQERDEHFTRLVDEVGRVISETLLVEVASTEEDMLATGALDSLTLIQLLTTLEERFGIRIALDQLQIEDVRSIMSIARLIETLRPANEQERGTQERATQPRIGGGRAVRVAL